MQEKTNLEEEAAGVEQLVEGLYKPIVGCDIKEINNLLIKIVENPGKIGLLKFLLYHSSSTYTKTFAANGLFQLFTMNFLTVDLTTKCEIYEFLIDFIVKNKNLLRKPTILLLNFSRNRSSFSTL